MFTTNPVGLDELLSQVDEADIQLPDFQRGWVWDDNRIRDLLASVSKGFPVGAIMTLASNSDMRFERRGLEGVCQCQRDEKCDCWVRGVKPSRFLLDGQQRLTSLFQALAHKGPVRTKDNRGKWVERWYYIDMLKAMSPVVDREDAVLSVPKTKLVTEDFGRQTLLDLSTCENEYKHHMIPTERLLDDMTWMFEYMNYWSNPDLSHPEGNAASFSKEFNATILKTFKTYLLPEISLTAKTPKEAVCTVFEKVNTGGVSLTVFELLTASFAADNFSLKDDWNDRKRRLSESEHSAILGGVGPELFLQSIVLLTTQERRKEAIRKGARDRQIPGIGCKRRDVLDLTLREYQDWSDKIENGFHRAAEFLFGQYVFRMRDIPYSSQLIPLAALFVELDSELNNADALSRLERWYWSGVFGEFYGGSNETQFALDLVQVARYVREGVEPALVNESNFIPERLLSLRTRNSAAYKGLFALQMKYGASDWLTGQQLGIATWLARRIDIHHIFPQAWCKQSTPPIPPSLYNSIINKTPLDATSHKKIGGHSPSRYLPRLEQTGIDQEELNRILTSHWINPHHLRADRYADHFVERGEAMLTLIGKAMGKEITGGRDVFKNALADVGFVDDYEDGETVP